VVVAPTIDECRRARAAMSRIAFVPTMGALHTGHLSLISAARQLAQHVAVSIFVNPTQFGPREDFTKYPRPTEQDLELCRNAGVELVFAPPVEHMYPPGRPTLAIDLPGLTDVLEGKHRPGHFSGVCQIVAKLFNIVQPDIACFGQKDFQQFRVISAMVDLLDIPVQVVALPTIREPDGLALSSRNRFLSPDQRSRALYIHRALTRGRQELQSGTRQANKITTAMRATLLDLGPPGNSPLGRIPFSIDYAVAIDPKTLKPLDNIAGPVVLAIAARVGETRLIDNFYLTESGDPIESA
jgi:pantoate--beta-alanine ligase